MARGPWVVSVHGGPWIGPPQWLTGGRSERCPGTQNLTAAKKKRGGDGGDPHRLEKGEAEGRK
jgi:hypothetical protein